LAECAATPEFAKWVADNAHRLHVEKDDVTEDDTIESSSNSSEETGEEAGKAQGQARRVVGARWVTAQGPQKIGAPKILRPSLFGLH
jgi:hypothetical protein